MKIATKRRKWSDFRVLSGFSFPVDAQSEQILSNLSILYFPTRHE
jgi:hypothetical protein